MNREKTTQKDPKTSAQPMPEGTGESAMRRERLHEGGGVPLTTPLEDGQLRGKDADGRDTTGTHGGPKKDGTERK